jgi:hypothetical protein
MMDGARESIFQDRTPHAAARQMARLLAYFAECQLATVVDLRGRKRTSKSELERHESIAKTLVYHIRDMKIQPEGLYGRPCSRLARALEPAIAATATGSGENLAKDAKLPKNPV